MILPSLSNRALFTAAGLLIAVASGCSAEGADSSGFVPGGGGNGDASSSASSGEGGAGGDIFSGSGGNVFVGSGGSTGSGGSAMCDPQLVGIVRDFKAYPSGGHPDFENYGGNGLKGIVQNDLGIDKKPVYAHPGPTIFTTGPAEFDQWYHDVPGVNMTIPFTIMLTKGPNGLAEFNSMAFFPIDNQGWGNEGYDHNYGFTYELHMVFQYNGGETFAFTGDDDLWVFVNNRLAIDLGGLHPPQSDTLNLDAKAAELGIVKGQQYPIDLFHAERHSTGSNFQVQSSLNFTNCDPIIIPE